MCMYCILLNSKNRARFWIVCSCNILLRYICFFITSIILLKPWGNTDFARWSATWFYNLSVKWCSRSLNLFPQYWISLIQLWRSNFRNVPFSKLCSSWQSTSNITLLWPWVQQCCLAWTSAWHSLSNAEWTFDPFLWLVLIL